jgi:ADP-ribosylglycohydrolase
MNSMDKIENLKLDKCLGALIGAAVGDALGWPQEQNSKNTSKKSLKNMEIFQKWTRRDGHMIWSHVEEIYAGEYSDDTQLIIATVRSLRYGSGWSKYFTKVELPAWLSYERGGGGATKRAAEAWKRGNNPWNLEKEKKSDVEKYFNAGGNGVAMRILPHIFLNVYNWSEVKNQVFLNGMYTHGHPRALIGAIIYADALVYLLNNEKTLGYGELVNYLLNRKEQWGSLPNFEKIDNWINTANIINQDKYLDIWNHVVDEVVSLLKVVKDGLEQGALDLGNEVLEKLGCFDKKFNGAGTVTAVAAIYLTSKYASSPDLALIEAAYLKNADTDTLASMVGGLIGILHGSKFLKLSWFSVQDYEFLTKLVNYKPVVMESTKATFIDYNNSKFKSYLKQTKIGDTFVAQPFGKLTLKERRLNNPNSKDVIVNTLKFVSDEGQSIFIKTYEKYLEVDKALIQERSDYIVEQQEIIGTAHKINTFKPLLDSGKLRGLVNLFPDKVDVDLCLLFIADVLSELERSGTGEIDNIDFHHLCDRWMKHEFDIKSIEKVIKVILKY